MVSNPLPPAAGTPPPSARPDLRDAWCARWEHVKFLEWQAENPRSRIRDAARDLLDQAREEAAAVRAEAHEEAGRIRAEAEEEVDRKRAEAEELLDAARQEAAGIRTKAEDDAAEYRCKARDLRAQAEELLEAVRQEYERASETPEEFEAKVAGLMERWQELQRSMPEPPAQDTRTLRDVVAQVTGARPPDPEDTVPERPGSASDEEGPAFGNRSVLERRGSPGEALLTPVRQFGTLRHD